MARAAYVIPREVFDARLVEAAVQRGAQLREHRVRTFAYEADHLVLDGSIRARVVIAADGASSVIRRQLAPRPIRTSIWPPDSPGLGAGSGHTAVAIRGYAPVAPSRAGQQIIVFRDPDQGGGSTRPAYAWSFPIGDGRANIGYGELLGSGRSLSRQHLLDRLDELLPGATDGAESWRAHLLPLSTGRPRQPDGRILFAGDAMNLINPVTGEGIFYAVASGVLAGRAALEPGDPGRAYRASMRRTLGVHLRHTDAATLLARSPSVMAAALRAADRNPRTFDDLVELGLGDGKRAPSALRGIAAGLFNSQADTSRRQAGPQTE